MSPRQIVEYRESLPVREEREYAARFAAWAASGFPGVAPASPGVRPARRRAIEASICDLLGILPARDGAAGA